MFAACEHVTKRVTKTEDLLVEFHKNFELQEEVWTLLYIAMQIGGNLRHIYIYIC